MNIQAMLRAMTGLNLSRTTVERAVQQRMRAIGHAERRDYVNALTQQELAELVELVVVPESWMFRDPQAFVLATDVVRERLAAGASIVRILSIPCAGGEEPYSMAMSLLDAGVAPQAFTIDAVDISTANIARAELGVFGRNAFRSQELAFRERFFAPYGAAQDEQYRIADTVRQCVRFRRGNLLTDDFAQARYYDVIFCRNLLIYFDQPTTAAAIARLSVMLADSGVLLAGYAEVPSFTQHGFSRVAHRQAFALRKHAERKGIPAAAPLPTATPRPNARPAPRVATPATKPAPAAKAAPVRAGPATKSAPAQTLLAHARLLADQGQLKQAEAACRDWLVQQPDAAEAYFILGLLAENASNSADAEAQLKRCLYLQPDHYEALCHLALLQEQSGNRSAAATLKARAARAYQRQHAT